MTSTNDEISEPLPQKLKKKHKTVEINVEMKFGDESVQILLLLLSCSYTNTENLVGFSLLWTPIEMEDTRWCLQY
jgi:hypothetical protein